MGASVDIYTSRESEHVYLKLLFFSFKSKWLSNGRKTKPKLSCLLCPSLLIQDSMIVFCSIHHFPSACLHLVGMPQVTISPSRKSLFPSLLLLKVEFSNAINILLTLLSPCNSVVSHSITESRVKTNARLCILHNPKLLMLWSLDLPLANFKMLLSIACTALPFSVHGLKLCSRGDVFSWRLLSGLVSYPTLENSAMEKKKCKQFCSKKKVTVMP